MLLSTLSFFISYTVSLWLSVAAASCIFKRWEGGSTFSRHVWQGGRKHETDEGETVGGGMPNPRTVYTHTVLLYIYIKLNHPLSFFPCVVSYSPQHRNFVPLSVNLIRIIIRAQASEAWASASPSVDLPLPPPHFFLFHPLLLSSPLQLTFHFLSHPPSSNSSPLLMPKPFLC